MKITAIYMMRVFLEIIYFFMKMRGTEDGRIVFLSRQSNTLSDDFKMIRAELLRRRPDIEIKCVCSRITGDEKGGKLKFAIDTLKSMWIIAGCELALLDAYWPAISLLSHKPSLRVIQMWHAMGKIKQSGYQTLGKEAGRSEGIARAMKMHEGYDYIIAGGRAWNRFYCESFGTTEDKLINIGLPRIDFLIDTADANRNRFEREFPELVDKKIVLYAPTFRRGSDISWECLAREISAIEDVVIIIKSHPNQKIEITPDLERRGILGVKGFSSVELLSSADYLITDYSAIAVEAAVLGIKTLYYVPDFEEYMRKNGMNIDLFEEMPGMVSKEAAEIANIIKNDSYDMDALKRYIDKFLPEELGKSTEKIADLIISNIS